MLPQIRRLKFKKKIYGLVATDSQIIAALSLIQRIILNKNYTDL